MDEIVQVAYDLALWTQQESARFTRYRGDGWQIYIANPRLSFRSAVMIQSRLMALKMESRISIGIGPCETLGTRDLGDAAGAAFEESGRGLDSMGESWRLGIAGKGVIPQDQQIADLLAIVMSRWTSLQAQAVALHLAPKTLRTLFDIGRMLSISPQAVSDRLRAAKSFELNSILERWEKSAGDSHWGVR